MCDFAVVHHLVKKSVLSLPIDMLLLSHTGKSLYINVYQMQPQALFISAAKHESLQACQVNQRLLVKSIKQKPSNPNHTISYEGNLLRSCQQNIDHKTKAIANVKTTKQNYTFSKAIILCKCNPLTEL